MITTHTYGDVTWFDVVDTNDDELADLAKRFSLEARTFDEANRRAARPMIQDFRDHTYLVAFSGELAEIDMFLGPDWLITVRRHDESGHEWDPSPALVRLKRYKQGECDAGLLLALMLDVMVEGYFDVLDVLEDRLEDLEDGVFTETTRTEKEVQHDLFDLRRELLKLRRAVVPLRDVLSAILRQEIERISGEALIVSRDTYDKLLRAIELVDDHRELLGNVVDAHLAVISNQMNHVMKKLTAWGAILFGAALIAGIYGMNFTHMPELRWQLGYPLAIGTMVLLSAVLYAVFKRKDYL